MQGLGNDYIYFDLTDGKELPISPNELSKKLSDRHFGIGGDGIVLIQKSDVADAKMRMFNADGSEGKMCGNAIRCVGKYLYENNIVKSQSIEVETLSGIKRLEINVVSGRVDSVTVNMGKPDFCTEHIPVNAYVKAAIDYPLTVLGKEYKINCVSMGNPHCVVFTDNLEFDIEKIGRAFENNKIFPDRVNTEFVKIIDKDKFRMRVWERGSGETMACGTGASAVAAVAEVKGLIEKNKEVQVVLHGGTLGITVTEAGVLMRGAAEKVFDGEIEI